MKQFLKPELGFWLFALLYLAVTDPAQPHFSWCIFQWLGFHHCPGCGIGRSISHLLHGDLLNSWQTHKLGTFALAVIVYRIIQLTPIKLNYGKSVSHA